MAHNKITISAIVNVPVEKAWECYNNPKKIEEWYSAGDGWHTASAKNDLKEGGRFDYRMEPRDNPEIGFNFTGAYTKVKPHELIAYTMDDGRKAVVKFKKDGDATAVEIEFDAENVNSVEQQRDGWQAILNSFKTYVENR